MTVKYINSSNSTQQFNPIRLTLLLLVLLLLTLHSMAVVKEIGVPTIQNFQRSEYNAGTQNWCSAQGITE